MAVREIVKYGNPILRQKMKPVKDFNGLTEIVHDMFDTMYEKEGIGLAANQIGLNLNLMVLDISHTDEMDEPMVCVNGVILDSWGEAILEEGCLSIPEIRLDIKRAEKVKYSYQDIDGNIFEKIFDGLLAKVIQHETDHLNGRLILDRVSSLKLNKHKKQLKQIVHDNFTVQ